LAKTILVTTDGSSRAHQILPHAVTLAKACDASLVLCRVLDARNDVAPAPGEEPAAALQRGRRRLEEELQATLARYGLEARPLVVEAGEDGSTADAILQAAAETGADLIAMQSRGAGTLRVALFGSVSHNVVLASPVPVMVGGPNLEALTPAAPYDIVFTTDGSPASDPVFHALGPLLDGSSIEASVVKVFTLEAAADEETVRASLEPELERAKALLPAGIDVRMVARKIAPGGGVDVAIMDYALETNADAIAMSMSARSTARSLVLGNTAELVVQRSRLPVILARAGTAS
jgi:nucleotide-binding universal stress UspA family protein